MSYLPQTTEKKDKVLTEKQQSFLDNLIQTGGDPKKQPSSQDTQATIIKL